MYKAYQDQPVKSFDQLKKSEHKMELNNSLFIE